MLNQRSGRRKREERQPDRHQEKADDRPRGIERRARLPHIARSDGRLPAGEVPRQDASGNPEKRDLRNDLASDRMIDHVGSSAGLACHTSPGVMGVFQPERCHARTPTETPRSATCATTWPRLVSLSATPWEYA